jgi:hypothetical protein
MIQTKSLDNRCSVLYNDTMKAHHALAVILIVFLGYLICRKPEVPQMAPLKRDTPTELETEQKPESLPETRVVRMARQEIKLKDVIAIEDESEFGWLFKSSKPYCLFEESTFRGNLPTLDTFAKFCNAKGLPQNEESFVKFERILEVDAFQSFILGYRLREIERHQAYEGSRTLTQELDVIVGYIHNLVIDEIEFWSAVNDYENEIVENTQREEHLVIGLSEHENRIMALLTQKKREILNL